MKFITIAVSEEKLQTLREIADSDMSVDELINMILDEFLEAQE